MRGGAEELREPIFADAPARAVAATVLSLALAGAACSRAEERAGPARRVILITCDTLRADRLGVYGYQRPTSPEVDAFAREALTFEQAYASAPWTGPSLSSLMTGRLPDEVGVPGGNRFPLPSQAVTLAELARDAGYATGAVVSNWVLRRCEPEAGDVGLAQGFQTYDDHMPTRELNREPNFERVSPDTTRAAIDWLEARARAGEDRFFLWVHYQDPHGPYDPPAELAAEFARAASPDASLALGTTNSGLAQIPAYQALGEERDPEVYRSRYDAEVRYFDQGFGELVRWLRGRGWLDDSLIVLTADHGESLGEHDYWFSHGEHVYREVVRVPLIVRYPRGAARPAAGARGGFERVESLVSHLDLWQTVREALDLGGAANRGTSLFARGLPPDRVAVSTYGMPRAPKRWESVGDARWRCVLPPGRAPQCFDVEEDPYETRDLAESEAARVQELLARHRAFLASQTGATLEARERESTPELESALERLGYAGD